MFDFKIDGVLEIGSSGIKTILCKKKKIEKLDYVDYTDMNEDKIIVLQEALVSLSKRTKLKGRNLVVTIPASRFYTKTLEYDDIESDETLEGRIESDLEEIVSGYSKGGFITQIEMIHKSEKKQKALAVTIPIDEIEKILVILESFKIRVLKIMPDFIALNNIVNFLNDRKEDQKEDDNLVIVDIGGESSKVLMSTNGSLNMVRTIGIGGNDFTEIIAEHEMLEHGSAEIEKYKLELGETENKNYKNQSEIVMFKELTDVANELVHQIENSIEYFNTNLLDKNVSKIYLTGGGSLLKGFTKYFDNVFEIPCEKINLKILELEPSKIKYKIFLSDLRMATLTGAFVKRGEKSDGEYEFFDK